MGYNDRPSIKNRLRGGGGGPFPCMACGHAAHVSPCLSWVCGGGWRLGNGLVCSSFSLRRSQTPGRLSRGLDLGSMATAWENYSERSQVFALFFLPCLEEGLWWTVWNRGVCLYLVDCVFVICSWVRCTNLLLRQWSLFCLFIFLLFCYKARQPPTPPLSLSRSLARTLSPSLSDCLSFCQFFTFLSFCLFLSSLFSSLAVLRFFFFLSFSHYFSFLFSFTSFPLFSHFPQFPYHFPSPFSLFCIYFPPNPIYLYPFSSLLSFFPYPFSSQLSLFLSFSTSLPTLFISSSPSPRERAVPRKGFPSQLSPSEPKQAALLLITQQPALWSSLDGLWYFTPREAEADRTQRCVCLSVCLSFFAILRSPFSLSPYIYLHVCVYKHTHTYTHVYLSIYTIILYVCIDR